MREAISISIKAERPYVGVLKRIAEAEGRTVAELVRDCIDARYGAQIRDIAPTVARTDRKIERVLEKPNSKVGV